MFQPETEDMLPRMAPKPSGSSSSMEPIVRPQVPEVSILFGQQANNMPQQQQSHASVMQQTQQTTSYAAWKKQMLPKVTFPPSPGGGQEVATSRGETMNNNNQIQLGSSAPSINSVYPLRSSVTNQPTSSNGYMANTPVPYSVTSTANDNPNVYMVSNAMTGSNPISYRKSIDNCGIYQAAPQQQQQPMYRKSMEMVPQVTPSYNSPRDVLTICAGTQTDAISFSPTREVPTSVASKQDVEDLKQMIQELRCEQHCLVQLMEKLLCSQFNKTENTESKDVGIQVNAEIKEGSPVTTNGHTPLPPVATNRVIQQLKQSPNILQTPKGKPMAQSTTYRPNSPQSNRLQEYQQPEPTPSSVPISNAQTATNYPEFNNNQQLVAALLPKPSTDKSLMMNELALRYLPNEKLAELLKELNMNAPKPLPEPPANTIPLRGIDNYERSPSDISNASYKYLKKYRLLPEDHIEDVENEKPREVNCPAAMNQQPQYGTPIRSPVQQRQNAVYATPKACSPYQHQQIGGNRLPQSPLARNDGTPVMRNNMLDLENIKHQPKFL
ncbi:anastral spindle 2 [Musca autumnalis]|uniref:anastral spindle 2 n=1 Tax=Musca autumnalis TaxID=221902 RepID=UPI003CF4353E